MLSYIIQDIQRAVVQANVMMVAANHTPPRFSPHNSFSLDTQDIYGKAPAEFGDAAEIVFPDDPSIVINIQDFGAKGNGVADDTQAI